MKLNGEYMTIAWSNYVYPPLGKATETDLNKLETILEVVLPDDYKDFIIHHQGMCPSKEAMSGGELFSAPFGPVFHIQEDCLSGQQSYGVIRKWNKWKDVYEGVVSIVGSAGSGCFYAFDYRVKKDNPSVVFVDVEKAPDDEDAILFVVNSWSEAVDSR